MSLDAFLHWPRVIAGTALDWLWPLTCLGCGSTLFEEESRRRWVCWKCNSGLPWLDAGRCALCLIPHEGGLCPPCLKAPPPWSLAHATFAYREPVRGWIHRFKYTRHFMLRHPLARLMQSRQPPWLVRGDWDALVPMPIAGRRLRQRGFHHTRLLAGLLGESLALPAEDGLIRRVRYRRPQVGLEDKERRANMAEAFDPWPGAERRIEGRRLLLIDDVMTTGASMRAAAQALKDAGALHVGIWVLARAGHAAEDV